MCSYESAVVTPALVILHDAHVDRRRFRARSSWLSYVILSGCALVYLIFRFVAGNKTVPDNQHFTPISALNLSLSSAYFIMDHLMLWFLPFGRQAILRIFDFSAPGSAALLLCSWFFLAILLVLAWLSRNRIPNLTFSAGVFLVTIAPVSNVIPFFSGPFADYYLVLPSIGLSFGVISGLRYLHESAKQPSGMDGLGRRLLQRCLVLLSVIWFALLAYESFGWIPSWNSERSLMQKTLAAYPESYTARADLARLLAQEGSTEAAENMARESVRQAPWYVQGFCILADVLLKEGKNAESLAIAREAEKLQPTSIYPLVLIGRLQEILGKPADAEESYRRALQLPWDFEQSATAALNLGAIYAESQRLADAQRVWSAALEKAPRNASIHYNMAIACYNSGDFISAGQHVDTARRLGLQVDSNAYNMLHSAAAEKR